MMHWGQSSDPIQYVERLFYYFENSHAPGKQLYCSLKKLNCWKQ